MNDQQNDLEAIHQSIRERYPMYIVNQGFEHWLLDRTGADLTALDRYFRLLDDYGYLSGDGTLAADYADMPGPSEVTGDIERRLAGLPPTTLEMLGRASVEGERFRVEPLAMPGGGLHQAEALLQPAVTAGVIACDRGSSDLSPLKHRYRFLPMRTRKMVYDRLSEAQRADYHASLVDSLSMELERADDPGARDMISGMISEHNKSVTRPDPPPEKE
ncbi:MAG: hypothetical protein JWQ98_1537 [Chlorobi bacterium]|nr:hypothetical protein [Chlorobiota bacterium]